MIRINLLVLIGFVFQFLFIGTVMSQIPRLKVGVELEEIDSTKNGKEIIYLPDTKTILSICNYTNGTQHGKCKIFNLDGTKEISRFKNGQNYGKQVFYDANGNKTLMTITKYKKGKRYYSKKIAWREDGKRCRIRN